MVKKKVILMLLISLLAALCIGARADSNTFAISSQNNILFEGDTLQLELTRTGLAEGGEITWTSAVQKVAIVDENGLVTAVAPGNCRINATCKSEGKTFNAFINLQVKRKVTSIALNEQRLTILQKDDPMLSGVLKAETDHPVLLLARGTSVSLNFTVEPKDASSKQVILSSSDESVLKVKGNSIQGLITGECDLTAASDQNPEISVTYHVLVFEMVKSVQISAPAKSIGAGETLQLTAAVIPSDATFPAVTWSVANEKFATVDENGVVSGLAKGNVAVKAQAVDGSNRNATLTINIAQLPEELALNEETTTVAVGFRKNLKAVVSPASTNDKKVSWSSSDENICTVNNFGMLIPVKAGTCTVTCSAQAKPDVKAVCTVVVTQPITKIIFSDKKTSVRVGDELQLKWTVEPDDVTDPSLVFTSNNQKVATVDENGVVHPVKAGQTTITARANDGSRRTASIIVQVIQPVLGVHMEADSVRVGVGERTTLKVVLEPADATNRNMTWTVADPDYATITGTNNKPVVRGVHWGSTTVHGVTEDGGFETDCTIDVGNYNKALKITSVNVKDNEVKLSIRNLSNMNITSLWGEIKVTDLAGEECPTTKDGKSSFTYRYYHPLAEGESTHHGQFQFVNYSRPSIPIGSVRIVIKGYETDTGFSWKIRNPGQTAATWFDPNYYDEPDM